MKNKKIVLAAFVTAAAMTAECVSASAMFEPYEHEGTFTTGHYTETTADAEREKTEQLYAARPSIERQYDYLSRGLVAVPGEGGTLVSWRFLGTDGKTLNFNLYCNGEKLNNDPITTTNYFHKDAPAGAEYTLREVVVDKEKKTVEETGIEYKTTAWDKNYISFKVTEREGYNIDDGAIADLDSDGDFEILLRRTPSMDVKTRTTYPLIEAYKTDGTHLWTIDIGPNEINEHDINIFAADMDGDGRAEVILRSFEGTVDGKGNAVGDTNGDGITDYSKDENNLAIFKDRQYVISTPEFLSVYDGMTGEELDRTALKPDKEPLSEWSYRYTDTPRLTKRASHYLFGLAYLDGVTPSIVLVRGAWDNVRAAAWHLEGGKLKEDWISNTPNTDDPDSIWGACNHNLICADVDFDGKDEILSGPMAIDDDGKGLYAVKAYANDGTPQKLCHGDAFDVAKMDPGFNGYLVWACHETKDLLANIELHDARTGVMSWGYGKTKDTGRSRAGDIDPTHRGHEVWGSTETLPMSFTGEPLVEKWNGIPARALDGSVTPDTSIPMNFKLYWDGDLLSELLDGVTISKYNWEDKTVDTIMKAEGCASNCGTKAVPCVCADMFGDWREEVVWKTEDEKEIRIYSTSIPTSYKIPTLMHDPYYRSCIVTQNNHYNQPANLSYYLGAETQEVPMFEGYVMHDGEKLTNPDIKDSHGQYHLYHYKQGWLSVKLLAGSPNAYEGNYVVKIDSENDEVVPFVKDDNTFVPVRFIAEALGMEVLFVNGNEVDLIGNGYIVRMKIGEKTYTINDIPYEMEVAPEIIHERTMIPLRAIGEATGRTVEWDEATGLIYVGVPQFYDRANAAQYSSALKNGK